MVELAANVAVSALTFVIGLTISTIIIYVSTRLAGERAKFVKALITAIAGSVIYSITYFLIGQGWLAAIVGGIGWLLALRGFYKIGWLKAFIIALLIWIGATIVGLILPTAPGPL